MWERSVNPTVDVGFSFPPPPPSPSSLRLVANHKPQPRTPLPSPEGCGSASYRSTEAGTPGGTQEVGGPGGASRKRATIFVVAHFRPSLFPSPPLTVHNPNADVANHAKTQQA